MLNKRFNQFKTIQKLRKRKKNKNEVSKIIEISTLSPRNKSQGVSSSKQNNNEEIISQFSRLI